MSCVSSLQLTIEKLSLDIFLEIMSHLKENCWKIIVVCGEQLEDNSFQVKMVKIQTEFSKLWFTILFCVFLITCCNAEFESQAFLDVVRFERMKNDLFRRSNETRSYYANSTDDWKCLQELNTIGIGLAKYELWAETSELKQSLLDRYVLFCYFDWYLTWSFCVYFWWT